MGFLENFVAIMQIIIAISTSIIFLYASIKFSKMYGKVSGNAGKFALGISYGFCFWSILFGTLFLFEMIILKYLLMISLFSASIAIFSLFLVSEYILNEQPRIFHTIIISILFGMMIIRSIQVVTNGNIPVTFTYIDSYGWFFSFNQDFLLLIGVFVLYTVPSLYRLLKKALEVAKSSEMKRSMKYAAVIVFLCLTSAIFFGIATVLWLDYRMFLPSLLLIAIIICGIFILNYMTKNKEMVHTIMSPHKAMALIVMNLEGLVVFSHSFKKININNSKNTLIGSFISAINTFVKQALSLGESDWIREFKTHNQILMLEVKEKMGLIGILIVESSTILLRESLKNFMNDIMKYNKEMDPVKGISEETDEFLHSKVMEIFEYLVFD